VNLLKKHANRENKEMKVVATYEQFLEECGQLNKELLEILDLRNALNTLRKEAGVVLDSTDITL